MFGSNLVFCPNLSLIWNCRCSESGFRSGVSLVRICLLCTFVFGPNLSVAFIWFSVRPGLWSEFVFPRLCRWSKSGFHSGYVFGSNLFFCPNLSLVRNCRCSESGFLAGVSFGPNFSFVHFCLWSELVGNLYLVFGTPWSLIWICLSPILSLVQIWFSHRICVWSESCFRTEFFFSPIFSLVAICLLSEFFFGPNLSLVRICRKTKCDFRSGFVFGLTLVSDPNLSLFRIWFLVRSFLWSEFVFCTILFLAEFVGGFYLVFGTKLSSICICLCSDFVARPNLVFTPDLCLVWICFSVRIRLWYEFVAVPNLVFGPCLPLVRLWFSIRFCLRSESGFRSGDSFGPNLSFVHLCFCSELLGGLHLVFGTNLSVLRFCC